MSFDIWLCNYAESKDRNLYGEELEAVNAAWEAALTKWLPIETAPKDTDILLFDGDKPYAKAGLYHVDGELTGWYLIDIDDSLVEATKQPTHWMPIPQQPKEQ